MSAWIPTVDLVVAERYRLVAPLDEGGMGTVWRAEHQSLRSPLAVKLLNPSIANNPEMLERFLREAQSAAALRSTHVVQVFDYGVHDGMPFIAMELLNGQSLGARLSQVGWLRPRELAWVFTHVSRAIGKAHEAGITHRDLKPDNIFLVLDGEVELAKVLDFGIAKVTDVANVLSQSSGNTQTGTVLGTPYYMSPEQARGNRAVDNRADLWAMGVIAFECLTGRLPFLSTALGDLVIKICTQPTPVPSSLASVPAGFDQWFAKACHKDPDHRYQTVKDLNEALQAVINEAPVASADLTAQHFKQGNDVLPVDLGAYQGFGQNSLPPLPTSYAPGSYAPPEPHSAPTTNVRAAEKKGISVFAVLTVLLATAVAVAFLGGVAWVALNIPSDGSDPKLPWDKLRSNDETPAASASVSGVVTLASVAPSAESVPSSSFAVTSAGSPGSKSKRLRAAAGSSKEGPRPRVAPAPAQPSSAKTTPSVRPPARPQKGVLDDRE